MGSEFTFRLDSVLGTYDSYDMSAGALDWEFSMRDSNAWCKG